MTSITKDVREFTPRYCGYLYRKELEEIENHYELSSPKWKKDVLIVLLEKSLTKIPNRKAVRKKVIREVNKATDRTFRMSEARENG